MSTMVDARGLSCPQPVLMTLETIKTLDRGEIVVLVDTDCSKENVIRAASSKGWKASAVQPEGIEYRLTFTKG